MWTRHPCQTWQDSRKLSKLQRGAVESSGVVSECEMRACWLYTATALMELRWTDSSPKRLGSQGCSTPSADCTLLWTMFRWKNAKQGFLLGSHKSPCPCCLGMKNDWKIETAGHLAKSKFNIWQEVCSCQELFLFASASDIYGFCAWSPCRWLIAERMIFIVTKVHRKAVLSHSMPYIPPTEICICQEKEGQTVVTSIPAVLVAFTKLLCFLFSLSINSVNH